VATLTHAVSRFRKLWTNLQILRD